MLQLAVYISYLFIIIAYSVKVAKIARMPLHLRWELYPVPHEKGYKYGGSYFEEVEWWNHIPRKNTWRSAAYLLKKYFLFNEYFWKKRAYWVTLYPWHVGFYLIVLFHILAFFGAVVLLAGIPVSAGSANTLGLAFYYLTIVVAVASFITGSFGSIGLLIERLANKELRKYAAPVNYFNYTFFLIVFLSGLVAWFFDPGFSTYREFWKSLITLKYSTVEAATYTHVMLFSLFLIYLPFSRSTHYITKFFSFFSVLWGDRPNLKGSDIEKQVDKLLDKPVTWAAPHIQSGQKWSEVASKMPEETPEAGQKK
ncbi:MAG: respiratory nitrate reductase subunit gamma [Chloroflexota bacterium]